MPGSFSRHNPTLKKGWHALTTITTRPPTPAQAPSPCRPAPLPLPRLPALPTRDDHRRARRLRWAVRRGLADGGPSLLPSALLVQTRRLLTAWGWAQTGPYVGSSQGLCIAGGLQVLATVGQAGASQVQEAETHIQRAIAPATQHFTSWNETPGRAWPEVSAVLITAARTAWMENR